MNSFRSLERAIDYEITRQIEAAESGEAVVQETRHWDEEAGSTHSMRTKEGSSDYRYFTEPDLAPMVMSREWVGEVEDSLPELPADRRHRYAGLGLDPDLAGVLSAAPDRLRQIFDAAIGAGAEPRQAANWLTGEVTAFLRRNETDPGSMALDGESLAELIAIVSEGVVSSSAAKEVLGGVLAGEGSPRQVAMSRDLVQISDSGELEVVVAEVLGANPDAVTSFKGGEGKAIGFLVGQVMRATGGKADPKKVNQLIRDKISD